MKSEGGNWKFWGPKPVPFQIDNESFYLGSDVANYLKLFRGKLYSTFPKLKTKKTQPGQNREIYVSLKPNTGGCLFSREKAVKDVESSVRFCFLVGVILDLDWLRKN